MVENTKILLKELDEGNLDFVLVEGFFDKQEYGYRLIREEPFICVGNRKHAYGTCEDFKKDHFVKSLCSLEDLMKETLLVREEGSGTRAVMEQLLSEIGRAHV